MHKLILFSLLPLACYGQSTVTVPAQQCVWHSGDDPSWAAATLDESTWQSNPHWQGLSPAAHIWVRCHSDLSSLQSEKQPALQVTLYAAYQLFLNGVPIGGAGNIRSGVFSMNVIRQYPVEVTSLSKIPETIALRITYRVNGTSSVTNVLNMDPPVIHAGDLRTLTAQRAEIVLTDSSKQVASAFGMSLIGVLGLVLFGLFYYDRSRFDLLYLGMSCLSLAILRVNSFYTAYQMNRSSLHFSMAAAGAILGFLTSVLFFFALARRRVPMFYWLTLAIITARYAINLITLLLPVEQALWFFRWTVHVFDTTSLVGIASVVSATAPFVAFWPYTRISGRMRSLAALCLLLGIAHLAWFIVALTNNPWLGLPNLLPSWRFEVLEIRGVVVACVPVALLVLLFRDQRKVTEERAILAGEMHAAQEIQKALVPASLETLPEFQIAVAFRPVRDVGGDFYNCRVLPGNRQRILLGDVSGKGAAAAMTAAVLIGAAQRRESESPAQLLQHLNLVMADMSVSGFATCLCAEISAEGKLTLANAGHLAPYRSGDELALRSGLPLGISSAEAYAENSFQLSPGDVLTLLSDGVVEAQSATGELFGFDRARSLSSQSADQIAHAAQSFGQEDDITVLTLTFAPVGVAHA